MSVKIEDLVSRRDGQMYIAEGVGIEDIDNVSCSNSNKKMKLDALKSLVYLRDGNLEGYKNSRFHNTQENIYLNNGKECFRMKEYQKGANKMFLEMFDSIYVNKFKQFKEENPNSKFLFLNINYDKLFFSNAMLPIYYGDLTGKQTLHDFPDKRIVDSKGVSQYFSDFTSMALKDSSFVWRSPGKIYFTLIDREFEVEQEEVDLKNDKKAFRSGMSDEEFNDFYSRFGSHIERGIFKASSLEVGDYLNFNITEKDIENHTKRRRLIYEIFSKFEENPRFNDRSVPFLNNKELDFVVNPLGGDVNKDLMNLLNISRNDFYQVKENLRDKTVLFPRIEPWMFERRGGFVW